MDSKISLNLIKNWKGLCVDIDFTDLAPVIIQNRVITVSEYQAIIAESKETRIESLLLLLLKKDEKVLVKFGESLMKDYSWLGEKVLEGYVSDVGSDQTDASPITRLDYDKETETDTFTEDEKSGNELCKDCHTLNSVSSNQRTDTVINNKNRNLGRRGLIKKKLKNRLSSKLLNSEAFISSTTEILKPVQNEEITNEVVTVLRKSPLVSRSWTTLAHSLGLTDKVNEIRYKVVLHGEDLNMCTVYLIQEWKEMFPKLAKLSKLIEILRNEGFNEVGDKLTDIMYKKT